MRLEDGADKFGPVRKIRKNYRSITGGLASVKAGGEAPFESSLERDFLILLEFDPQVVRISPQPVRLQYRLDGGRSRLYTPDVLVHYQGGQRPGLFEVKYVSEIREKRDHFRRLFPVVRDYARDRGWTFTLMTEKSLRGVLLDNTRFLLPFRDPGRVWSHGVRDELLSRLQTRVDFTPQTLLATVAQERRAELLPLLWHLVATGQVMVNMHLPLTLNSPLTRVGPL